MFMKIDAVEAKDGKDTKEIDVLAWSWTEEENDPLATAHGANYSRSAQIKTQYDPDNLFPRNQNIKPLPRPGY